MTEITPKAFTSKQKLGIASAVIFFLVGWFHTGLGLQKYQILGSEYGGFLVATGFLFIMIIGYSMAVAGSKTALFLYLTFAFVTMLCNLNSFYPNYRADTLVREELRGHRASLVDIRENIKNRFYDTRLHSLAKDVRGKKEQLTSNIRQLGFGPRSEETLKQIEELLGTTFTRKLRGRDQSEWNATATEYDNFVEKALQKKLGDNRFDQKNELLSFSEEHYSVFNEKIDTSLNEKTTFKKSPDYVENIVKSYRDLCKRAVALAIDDDLKRPFTGCTELYESSNVEIGAFGHTFKSIWQTLSNGGTIAVLIICLVIDFIVPLALYLLIRRRDTSIKRSIWILGGKEMPQSVI